MEVCAACGECCFEPGGILCGYDEWPLIRDALPMLRNADVQARPIEGTGLVILDLYGSDPSLVKDDGRRPCLALQRNENGWRCAIEEVKPAGCIAYPLKLVLRQQEAPDSPVISLESCGVTIKGGCALEKMLSNSPGLLQRYSDGVRDRVASREGTFALAMLNARQAFHVKIIEGQ